MDDGARQMLQDSKKTNKIKHERGLWNFEIQYTGIDLFLSLSKIDLKSKNLMTYHLDINHKKIPPVIEQVFGTLAEIYKILSIKQNYDILDSGVIALKHKIYFSVGLLNRTIQIKLLKSKHLTQSEKNDLLFERMKTLLQENNKSSRQSIYFNALKLISDDKIDNELLIKNTISINSNYAKKLGNQKDWFIVFQTNEIFSNNIKITLTQVDQKYSNNVSDLIVGVIPHELINTPNIDQITSHKLKFGRINQEINFQGSKIQSVALYYGKKSVKIEIKFDLNVIIFSMGSAANITANIKPFGKNFGLFFKFFQKNIKTTIEVEK